MTVLRVSQRMSRKIIRRGLIGMLGSYALFSLVAGIMLAEFSLKLPRRPISDSYRQLVYQRVAIDHARLEDASIRAKDGILLRGWFVKPDAGNGSVVVLLHGVTDNRLGMAGYGEFLLQHGYSVLLPDARDHGESEGHLASYGLREGEDVHKWVDWIYQKHPPNCVYGLGESMGAAILLQSLASEKRFCAVVAESSFADFREGAYDRVSHYTGSATTIGARTLLRPAIEIGVMYARLRYGLNLTTVSPRQAVADSATPVLLIHGAIDVNIRPRNSELIHKASLDHSVLWEVPMAAHCGAWSTAPHEFEARLLSFFSEHSTRPNLRG
jgi:dipeptidyl aminopeptidase/acylaminoacyl peptidase